MNKIDLIIDEIDGFLNSTGSVDYYPLTKALAAARELQALKPVGEIRSVVWGGMAWTVGFISHEKLNLRTKLYALDEVTK